MLSLALGLILVAAGLHAGWNVLLKAAGDPLRTSARATGATALLAAPLGALAWLLSGRPALPAQEWPLIALSALLELAYFNFLSSAYRQGELSVVYPLARGTAPLLAVLAGLFVLHEHLSTIELAGVGCLLVGIWAVRRPVAAGPATVPALLTGLCIASYSAINRVGVGLAPPWLYAWAVWTCNGALLTIWVWLGGWPRLRHLGRPAAVQHADSRAAITAGEALPWPRATVLGLMMGTAYLLTMVALSLAPLTVVAPLRESAIVVVTGWGIWRLKERDGAWLRLSGAAGIVLGAVLLAI